MVIFDYFIEWKSRFDSILRNHLDSSPRNARYLSPQIQNELISCLGDEIRESVVKHIEKSNFYSVMADETTDESTKTQLSICVRYLTDNFEVEEAFLGFVDLHKTDAETISEVPIDNVQQWGLDSSKWRGQGYDGASTMSGHVSGVQARITSKLPKAKFFVHCRSHCLNLAIVASCSKVPEIRNFMDTFKSITFFFSASPKRKGILSEKLSESAGNDLLADSGLSAGTEDDQCDVIALRANKNRYHLPTLSDTRWLSRVDSISTLLSNYEAVHEALDEVHVQSTGQSSHDAALYLYSMSAFCFIVAAVICQYILAFTRPLSVVLQSKECDLVLAHEDARNLVATIQSQRSDERFHLLYSRATAIASKVGVSPTKPRTVNRQVNRANANVGGDIEVHYKVNFHYPFIDHVIQHLNDRFPEEIKGVLLASFLIPLKLHLLDETVVAKIEQSLGDELPNNNSRIKIRLSLLKEHLFFNRYCVGR